MVLILHTKGSIAKRKHLLLARMVEGSSKWRVLASRWKSMKRNVDTSLKAEMMVGVEDAYKKEKQ